MKKRNEWAASCACLLTIALVGVAQAKPKPPQVGVYYYPGWANDRPKGMPKAWDAIKKYPDREPFLGWYPEGDAAIMKQQLMWMKKYKISYLVFDWYWNKEGQYHKDAINAYKKVPQKSVKYSILWANHPNLSLTPDSWREIVDFWIVNYLHDRNYLTIDGKPVIFIFSSAKLMTDAEASETTPRALLEEAQSLAKASGLKGIYFVAGQTGGIWSGIKNGSAEGYSAVSAYNYHPATGQRGFDTLNATYEYQWKLLSEQLLPVVLPMTSGWDRKPLGGSQVDDSIASPTQFEQHLTSGRHFAEEHGYKYGVICCWNEYGEGSYIEPTKKDRFSIISQVRKAFSK